MEAGEVSTISRGIAERMIANDGLYDAGFLRAAVSRAGRPARLRYEKTSRAFS